MQSRWLMVWVAMLFLGVPGLQAQKSPAAVEPTPAAQGVDEASAAEPPPPVLLSARATMSTFLEAFYAEGGVRYDQAEMCLDLEDLPPQIRSLRARELVVELKTVIDRTRYVRLEKISDAPDGAPYVFLRTADGEVVIDRHEGGRWLFTADSVASVDALYRATEGREVVSGIQEAPRAATPAMWLRGLVPGSLRGAVLFLEGWQWIGLVVVVLAGLIADRAFVFLGQGVLDRFLRARLTTVEPELLRRTLRPAGLLVMTLVWWFGIAWLGLPVGILAIYGRALTVFATLVAVVTAYQLVNLIADLLAKRAERTLSRFDDLLVPLVRKSLKVVVVAIGFVYVAQNLGTDVGALLAGLGLGGLAFALAAQDTVSNLFGSLTVLVDRPFQVGDWVVVGDVEGTVEEVGFRSTRIRTFYNSLITLPNSTLTNAAVDNLGARSYRRWSTTIGIAYHTPPEKIDAFCEGIRELVRCHPYTRKDYYHVYLNGFGPASLDILIYIFFETKTWATELRERHRLGVDIVRLAAELGVEFAFPTQTLYLRREQWEAPARADDGYAAGSRRLEEEARSRAQRLVVEALEREVPPQVQFDIPDDENRGSSGA